MRVINEQDVFDIIDDLRDRMTVVGYWSMVERIKALPSATCGNLEKPEIPQHSEGEAADCNLDCISRQAAIRVASGYCHPANIADELRKLPSAQPDLSGYSDKLWKAAYERGKAEALDEIIHCKDCKHWKDSDGVYRRGIGAESKCPVNIRAVYEGNFYCADAERRTDG